SVRTRHHRHQTTHSPHSLSLHDALPIPPGATDSPTGATGSASGSGRRGNSTIGHRGLASNAAPAASSRHSCPAPVRSATITANRSEEHTSEIQSREKLVCRLLIGQRNSH